MIQLILKATNVKHPGARGAPFWVDAKGKVRYDERPTGRKRPHKYLAHVVFSDGTERYIEPRAEELDENGQVLGGQPAIREIVNRELFGDYGFKDGVFWQKKGALIEYKTRTDASGKVVVDPIQRHEGYTSFEFRDSSVARAYGGSEDGLPKKITQYKVAAKPKEPIPTKDKIELPEGATSDQPPTIEELGIHNVPKRLPDNRTAIGEPLQSEEDPIAIANAFLEASLRAKRPSKAKTEAGQQRAREERKDQFDEIVGKREIKALPAWAVNKFDNAEHLQTELSREGRPLTTLITLGIWNPDNKSKRVREQLVREWTPFIRRWARRFASVFTGTDIYRQMDEVARTKDGASARMAEASATRYIRDRERDLFNDAVVALLHEANVYVPNDEPHGQYSRFDKRAENVIKNNLERIAKEASLELGATALEDLHEAEEYRAPKMISPREHLEVRLYEPRAKQIIKDAIADLPHHVRLAFESRLWMDDEEHPDASQEREHAERRARQAKKVGRSATHWGRPWTGDDAGVQSIATRLAELTLDPEDAGKLGARTIGDLGPQHQKYYLEKWYNEALEHLHKKLKTKSGALTPDGVTVERWLRLEQRVASLNRREIQERTKVPIAREALEVRAPSIEHVRAHEHPAVTFFSQPGSNRELAQKLGLVDLLDVPAQIRHVSVPKASQHKLDQLNEHYKLIQNLRKIPDLGPVHEQAHAAVQAVKDLGAWNSDVHGSAEWHENVGVSQLHHAAVTLHKTKGEDAAAVTAFTEAANALGADHPMVKEYLTKLQLGAAPSSSDLAAWRTRQHAVFQQHQNRMHVVEFEQEHRAAGSVLKSDDLRKAFADCLTEYDLLAELIKAVRIVKQPGSRGGIWHRDEDGNVVYGRNTPPPPGPESFAGGAFDAREHMKQIETHRYTEDAHRQRMNAAKDKIVALNSDIQGATPKQRAGLNRKLATAQKEHDEHHEIVTATKAARLQAQKDMEAARAQHAEERKRTVAEQKEAAEQLRAEKEQGRGAILRIGGHRMHEDPETVRRDAIMAIGDEGYQIAGEPEPVPQPIPMPKDSEVATKPWLHEVDNTRGPNDRQVVSYRTKTPEEWNQEDKARRQREVERYQRQKAKYDAIPEEERKRNRELRANEEKSRKMRATARELPQHGGDEAVPMPVSHKPIPEAKVRGGSLFHRIHMSLRRIFGSDTPIAKPKPESDQIAASLRGRKESGRISSRRVKKSNHKRRKRSDRRAA